jgi:hypothetical protein
MRSGLAGLPPGTREAGLASRGKREPLHQPRMPSVASRAGSRPHPAGRPSLPDPPLFVTRPTHQPQPIGAAATGSRNRRSRNSSKVRSKMSGLAGLPPGTREAGLASRGKREPHRPPRMPSVASRAGSRPLPAGRPSLPDPPLFVTRPTTSVAASRRGCHRQPQWAAAQQLQSQVENEERSGGSPARDARGWPRFARQARTTPPAANAEPRFASGLAPAPRRAAEPPGPSRSRPGQDCGCTACSRAKKQCAPMLVTKSRKEGVRGKPPSGGAWGGIPARDSDRVAAHRSVTTRPAPLRMPLPLAAAADQQRRRERHRMGIAPGTRHALGTPASRHANAAAAGSGGGSAASPRAAPDADRSARSRRSAHPRYTRITPCEYRCRWQRRRICSVAEGGTGWG